MAEKLHIGSAWEDVTVGEASKRYYRVVVDLGGMVPPMYCRIVENPKPKSDRSPSHYMFFSPVDGEDRRVGSFWPRTSEEAGTRYLMGQITPFRFGVVELKGGAKLDLRLADGTVGVKLVAAKPAPDSDGKNRPTHYLLRITPHEKKEADGTAEEEEAA